jgi:hypothetical protein
LVIQITKQQQGMALCHAQHPQSDTSFPAHDTYL